jgi:uncharacterized protein (UPF0218 family)
MLLPEGLKPKLRKVYGKLCTSATEALQTIESIPNHGRIITIGDVISYNVISSGATPDIIVYDGMEGREKTKNWMKNFLDAYMAEEKSVKNPAGHITSELWQTVFEVLRSEGKSKLYVKGEEDLAVIPFAILCPPRDCILYGIPGEGIDLVVVDKKVKGEFKKILKQFKNDIEDEKKRTKRLKDEKIREMFKGKK